MTLIPYTKNHPFSLLEDFFDWGYDNMQKPKSVNQVVPVELETDDQNVYIRAEVPGLEKKDIEVEYQDGIVSIGGEKKKETKEKKNGTIYSELARGHFKRYIRIGKEVDFDKATAEYKNGILEIKVPKAKAAKASKLLIG